MQKLPLTTQTLYAELLEQLAAYEAHRSIGALPGCFTTKAVKGDHYVYFQNTAPGGVIKQIYLGKKTPAVEKVMERFQKEKKAVMADAGSMQMVCAQLRAGGALTTDASSARVIKALADCGVFRLNGVLVGTHAYTVLGNLLGVRWAGEALKTQDIDIAGEKVIEISLPHLQADVPQALESLNMGFLPVPPLNAKHPSTSFKVRGNPLRVDIVTPAGRKLRVEPVAIPRFNTAAQPLRFLDFLIEKPVSGAIINGGGIQVTVPDPARFALHKLIIAQERGISMHSKTEKDLVQASQVIRALCEERPGDVRIAWGDLQARGNGWVRRLRSGIRQMKKKFAEEAEMLTGVIGF